MGVNWGFLHFGGFWAISQQRVNGSTPNFICVGTMSAYVPLPAVGTSGPWEWRGVKNSKKWGVVSFVHRTATISVFFSASKCGSICRAMCCDVAVLPGWTQCANNGVRLKAYQWRLKTVIRHESTETIVPHSIIWSWYTGRWWMGCYIWYSREKMGGAAARPVPSSLFQMWQPIHQRPVYQSPCCCIMVCCSAF